MSATARDVPGERLRRHRELLRDAHAHASWDVVALTASSASQAAGFRARLDALHADGALPGERERYVVLADPPGPRRGSGGATLAVCRELPGLFGDAWRTRRVFCLHTGGHSERAPQHGACGKAFAEIPMDAGGYGWAATVLEAQLVQLTPLCETLPPGVFVSCADVSLEYDHALGNFDRETVDAMARGITALAHPSSVAIGEQHGVFVCDAERVAESAQASRRAEATTPLECHRCLQKPSVDEIRAAGCVMQGDIIGRDDEWVLTDSCFHIGVDAVEALIELYSTQRDILAGCEICAYGDFMQPLGRDANLSYIDRVDHLASVTSSSVSDGEMRLREARRAIAEVLSGRPLMVLPLIPSRFIHLGTIPEFLYHTTKDRACLQSLPAPCMPVKIASWSAPDFRQPEDTCIMSSRIGAGTTLEAGSCVVNCMIGQNVSIGQECALYDVFLESGAVVESRTFMFTLPVKINSAAVEFVTIVMNIDDVVKSQTSSTICGVHVEEAALALSMDATSVWRNGESHTTTLGRFYSVHKTPEESARCALRLAQRLRTGENLSVSFEGQVSINEVLRTYTDTKSIMEIQHDVRSRILGMFMHDILQTNLPAKEWSAKGLAGVARMYEGSFLNAENIKNDLFRIMGNAALESQDLNYVDSMRHHLDVGRVALSLRVPYADEIAQTCLRTVIVRPLMARDVRSPKPLSRFDVRVSYPARFNLAGGWTDTPPFSLERRGAVLHVPALINGERPIVATVIRQHIDNTSGGFIRLIMKNNSEDKCVELRTTKELMEHRDPSMSFALHKAVVTLFLFPEMADMQIVDASTTLSERISCHFGPCTIELRTEVNLPKGSGLGTSSILALAMFHALAECAFGEAWKPRDESGREHVLAGRVDRHDSTGHCCEVSGELSNISLSVAIHSVLAVEQMIRTGGGWQDQLGGALEGLRLSRSTPGEGAPSTMSELPVYSYEVVCLSDAAKALINSRFACIFTGTCRLAKTVCDSVVTTWQRRDDGVELALTQCANLASEMIAVFSSLGRRSDDELANGGGDVDISRLGELLEKHKIVQQSLWPSIESPTIRAIYDAISHLSHGSFICGAGSGGHVIAFLKPGVDRESIIRAVRECSDAPEARVVDATMLL